ncbi:MAG: acetyl-CoA carboxylase biotin carboxylase subunit [candidate division Zixibacteria bacterium]|nr:acetyl-CoA carboxylase biotin carboxylase subunit [candidate division Zixibacteria bacterium]
MSKPIKKILIANRGEIAVRIIRACKELGIKSVAVFSAADRSACHVAMADEAYFIGEAPSSESYLVQDKIIETAKKCQADAIHPGYGFLAENAEFAGRCVEEKIIFIGPKAETIELLGDKIKARRKAIEAGLPVLPGEEIDVANSNDALAKAESIGFPVLIKAIAGGGGKGMRVVHSADDFGESLLRASSEAKSAFGDGRVFIEKFLQDPRHIEFQILCDAHGQAVHLGERECSIQRRHQKLIEESPSPVMTPELRQKMGEAALKIARASNYVGAGTVEFMVDQDLYYYFLEVNTRLQVEHPVTELVTAIDLVKEQIAIAENKKLSFSQNDISFSGHAIECRISAEDPQQGFVPSTGTIQNYRMPSGPGVRLDSGVESGSEISVYYDPLFAKLIVWGKDRPEAISRMKRALEEFRISGLKTTIGFHRIVMENENFVSGNFSTKFIETEYPNYEFETADDKTIETAAIAAAIDKFKNESRINLQNGKSSRAAISSWSLFHRQRNMKKFSGSR